MTTGVNAVNTSFVYGDNVATTGTTSDTVLVQNNDNHTNSTWKVGTVIACNVSAGLTSFRFGFRKYSNPYGSQDQTYYFYNDISMNANETIILIDKTRPIYLFYQDALIIQCDPVADIKYFASWEKISTQ